MAPRPGRAPPLTCSAPKPRPSGSTATPMTALSDPDHDAGWRSASRRPPRRSASRRTSSSSICGTRSAVSVAAAARLVPVAELERWLTESATRAGSDAGAARKRPDEGSTMSDSDKSASSTMSRGWRRVRRVEQPASLECAVSDPGPRRSGAQHADLRRARRPARMGRPSPDYDRLMRLLERGFRNRGSCGPRHAQCGRGGVHTRGRRAKADFSLARRLGREGTNDAIWRRERADLQAAWQREVTAEPSVPSPRLSRPRARGRGDPRSRRDVSRGYASVAFLGLPFNREIAPGAG